MKETTAKFLAFMQERINQCQEEEHRLIAEERKDEANICRIRANIYDIFQTLFRTSLQQEEAQGWDAVCRSFEAKATRIPANWNTSYEKAKEHKDAAKILIEEEKLAAVSDIMNYYQEQIAYMHNDQCRNEVEHDGR